MEGMPNAIFLSYVRALERRGADDEEGNIQYLNMFKIRFHKN